MKKIDEKLKYEGIIVDVYEQTYDFNGRQQKIEYVQHPGGVCIAAEDDDGYFYLVEQFRFGTQTHMLEFPAGLIDKNEDPQKAALRELREEIGYEAQEIVSLGYLDVSPGYLNERSYLYYASKLHFVGQHWDEFEDLVVKRYSLSQLIEMIVDGTITDAKTIALVLKVKEHMR